MDILQEQAIESIKAMNKGKAPTCLTPKNEGMRHHKHLPLASHQEDTNPSAMNNHGKALHEFPTHITQNR
jgi:hypothetical protein